MPVTLRSRPALDRMVGGRVERGALGEQARTGWATPLISIRFAGRHRSYETFNAVPSPWPAGAPASAAKPSRQLG
jgi:hypothetical protein